MTKKYQFCFNSEKKEYKIATLSIDDERFSDYILTNITDNLEYYISELQENFDLKIDNFIIVEIDNA